MKTDEERRGKGPDSWRSRETEREGNISVLFRIFRKRERSARDEVR